MRAFVTDLVHVFLSVNFYTVCLLAGASIVAFRCDRATVLFRSRFWLVAATTLFYLASAEIVGNYLYGLFESAYPVPVLRTDRSAEATVLVLTAGTPRLTAEGYRSRLSADGVQRVTAGVEAWRRTGGKLMFSGAPTPDLTDSMAHEMARLAVGLGVPREVILLEDRSTNTYENLLFSKKLIQESGPAQGYVVMVASGFQMPRAVAVARRLALEVVPLPCGFENNPTPGWQYWVPSNDGAQMFESVLHELIGMAAYRSRNWI